MIHKRKVFANKSIGREIWWRMFGLDKPHKGRYVTLFSAYKMSNYSLSRYIGRYLQSYYMMP
nr:MAG TPA: hypothetical protein [Caudoviricetes sp.]